MHYSVQAHWQQPLLKIRHSSYYSDARRGWSSALVSYDENMAGGRIIGIISFFCDKAMQCEFWIKLP